jgi:hypothetical protein
MNLHERCLGYARSEFGQKFPDSIPYVSPTGRWVYGTWNPGANFQNRTRYPGAYPRTFVERVLAMFPDVRPRQLLHVFAGSLPPGKYARLDVKADLAPEIVGDVYALPALLAAQPRLGPFRLVMADPPYPGQARKLYGTPEVQSWRVFQAFAAALAPGAHVVWLSTAKPLFRKDQWHQWGAISVERSTGHAYRKASFFERRAA